VDTSRLTQGDMIAGAGGLGLFLFLFLDWILEASAWEVFDLTDILLAIIGIGVLLVVAARAAGTEVGLPGGPAAIALAGFAATVIVLVFIFEGEERGIGLWLSLLAALAITYGGWQAARGGVRPAHHATTSPPPPPPAA